MLKWLKGKERKLSMGLNIVFLGISAAQLMNGQIIDGLKFFIISLLCIGTDLIINKLKKIKE